MKLCMLLKSYPPKSTSEEKQDQGHRARKENTETRDFKSCHQGVHRKVICNKRISFLLYWGKIRKRINIFSPQFQLKISFKRFV